MRLEDLHALADRLAATARERLLRDGRHDSVAYLHVGGVSTSVAVTLAAAPDRAVVRRPFESAAREGAQACALIREAWNESGAGMLVVEAACAEGHTLREMLIERAGEGVRLRATPPTEPSATPLIAGLWGQTPSR